MWTVKENEMHKVKTHGTHAQKMARGTKSEQSRKKGPGRFHKDGHKNQKKGG